MAAGIKLSGFDVLIMKDHNITCCSNKLYGSLDAISSSIFTLLVDYSLLWRSKQSYAGQKGDFFYTQCNYFTNFKVDLIFKTPLFLTIE